MNSLYADCSTSSVNKHGEILCGDMVQIIRKTEQDSMVMVLADGLGSGVKANILATLTSKIISTMMANQMSIEQCVSAIAKTLPVCEERKIAYSTFTIIKIDKTLGADIIQYDNPQVIMLRDGKCFDYQKSISELSGKVIYHTRTQLKENDVLVAMSDGALYASEGRFLDTAHWRREDILDYLENIYDKDATAQNIQGQLLDKIEKLYGNKPGDDTTICVVKTRRRKSINVMVGPPLSREDDEKMLSLFFSKHGDKIVCGGTTALLVSKYLAKPIEAVEQILDEDIPPISKIDGVDLVTEGIVTLNRVLYLVRALQQNPEGMAEYSFGQDGASLIAQALIDKATDINFFVGKAVNSAHQNSKEIVEFGIKQHLVEELVNTLSKLDKNVRAYYF